LLEAITEPRAPFQVEPPAMEDRLKRKEVLKQLEQLDPAFPAFFERVVDAAKRRVLAELRDRAIDPHWQSISPLADRYGVSRAQCFADLRGEGSSIRRQPDGRDELTTPAGAVVRLWRRSRRLVLYAVSDADAAMQRIGKGRAPEAPWTLKPKSPGGRDAKAEARRTASPQGPKAA
jgi:hypothetical protein